MTAKKRRAALVVALMSCSVAAVLLPALHQFGPRIVYNASDSMARGWYRVRGVSSGPDLMYMDDIVLVPLPAQLAAWAVQRDYLPQGVALLKHIAARAPQQVCAVDGMIFIDGRPAVPIHLVDGRGRPMPRWQQCRALHDDEIFVLGTYSAPSFDSRYFGPLRARDVIGLAQPLWTWGVR